MSSKILFLAVASLLATTTGWTADKNHTNHASTNDAKATHPSKQESVGIGSGALIGAAAGGPVGFIIGAAFGGWLGDRFHHEKSERLASEQRYEGAQVTVQTLQGRLAVREREVAHAVSELSTQRIAHRSELQQALAIEVFFRTEASALDDETQQRLAHFAQLIVPMEGTLIHLEGHADGRGDQDYNAMLSAARAGAVRDALISGGLPAERILLSAEGEAQATAEDKDVDGMAMERRVQMRLVDVDGTSRVAQHAQE